MANEDRRGNTLRTTPVFRKELTQIAIPDSAAETTSTTDVNGIIGTAVVVVGDLSDASSVTLSIKDEDGYELYSQAGIAESATTVLSGIDVLAAGYLTIGLTPNADTNGTSTVDLVFYVV